MESADQQASEDTIDATIDLPSFLLALKEIARSPIAPDTIKALLASVTIKKYEKTTSNTDTLEEATMIARSSILEDFTPIKQFLAKMCIEGCNDTNTSLKRSTDEGNERKRSAEACLNEVQKTPKKKKKNRRRKSSNRKTKDNGDTRDESARKFSGISNSNNRAYDGTESACDNSRKSSSARDMSSTKEITYSKTAPIIGQGDYDNAPSTSKAVNGYTDGPSTSNGVSSCHNTPTKSNSGHAYTAGPSTSNGIQGFTGGPSTSNGDYNGPSASNGVPRYQDKASTFPCELCNVVYMGRSQLDIHYRRHHNIDNPNKILFLNGKTFLTPLFTNDGKAKWFIDEREKALKRYKEQPGQCRLCDFVLYDKDHSLLACHYQIGKGHGHKIEKMYNIERLFKHDLPTDNPHEPRTRAKSKTTEIPSNLVNETVQGVHIKEEKSAMINDSGVISISDDEDNIDSTTSFIQPIKREDEDKSGDLFETNTIRIEKIKSEPSA